MMYILCIFYEYFTFVSKFFFLSKSIDETWQVSELQLDFMTFQAQCCLCMRPYSVNFKFDIAYNLRTLHNMKSLFFSSAEHIDVII